MAISTGSPFTLQVPLQLPSLSVDLFSTWSSLAFLVLGGGVSTTSADLPSIRAPFSTTIAASLVFAATAPASAPFATSLAFPTIAPASAISAASLVFAATAPTSAAFATSLLFSTIVPISATFAISVVLVTEPAELMPFGPPMSMAISNAVPPKRCPGVSSVILYSSRLNWFAFARLVSAMLLITLAFSSASLLPNTFPQKANEFADSSISRLAFSIPPLTDISASPTTVLLADLAIPFCCSIGFHPSNVERSSPVSFALSAAIFPMAFPIFFVVSQAVCSGSASTATLGLASWGAFCETPACPTILPNVLPSPVGLSSRGF
ncbi:hypothetical protein Xekj_02139 [Xenorhabdus sp. KJ12.1]|nr:hypothetical protein Xekj_02139 [Xenorhabdus sp. KJ12.1]